MFKPNIPPSLEKLEEDYSEVVSRDRFIKNISLFRQMETELRIGSRHDCSLVQDSEESENSIFNSILEINLNQGQRRQRGNPKSGLSFENDKILIPDLSRYRSRQVPKTPFKILDAPNLQDDYYVNIIDWGQSNTIAVGLANSCYLWNFSNNQVEKVSEFEESNLLTSLAWNMRADNSLAIGAMDGKVEVFDVVKKVAVQSIYDHKERVGAISFHEHMLLTGSRDRRVIMRDTRQKRAPCLIFDVHQQEVCGLKWSPDGQYFASGGNDNLLFVFSPKTDIPLMKKTHKAAVRAISWSERQYGILATGSGTADRCIRVWNLNERKLNDIRDTGSQICNIVFSKNEDEIITSQGFSHNDICIWKTKGLKKTHSLLGHTHRVLHLAISPCGNFIVSGAGDETLRFWNLNYPQVKEKAEAKEFSLSSMQISTLR